MPAAAHSGGKGESYLEIFRVENLNFTYLSGDIQALSDVSFTLNEGEFITVCGASGCGKTTLLRLLKKEIAPFGKLTGQILLKGQPQKSTARVGFVMQNPEDQIVTDKVWHELAFGLENLGLPNEIIRLRVGEMAAFFGIESWFRWNTADLSGGQKQLLNLAAVMAMQPEALLLDEPTAQLDPIAAGEFIATLARINRELGTAVLIAEHRLEDIFPVSDRVLVMEDSCITLTGKPRNVCEKLPQMHPIWTGLPMAARLFRGDALSVREGRAYAAEHYQPTASEPPNEYGHAKEKAVACRDIWFRYDKQGADVLTGLSLSIYENEIYCLLGGNGSGKTTLLKLITGLQKPWRGKIQNRHKPLMLPQDPVNLFAADTVGAEIAAAQQTNHWGPGEVEPITDILKTDTLLNRHPFDLSGGEIQRCALLLLLLRRPKILLLDEPTKGLDAGMKAELWRILRALTGVSILLVTHDIEFAAYADRCGLLFDGGLISEGPPGTFFPGNQFYTTAANRILRPICETAVTYEDASVALEKAAPR